MKDLRSKQDREHFELSILRLKKLQQDEDVSNLDTQIAQAWRKLTDKERTRFNVSEHKRVTSQAVLQQNAEQVKSAQAAFVSEPSAGRRRDLRQAYARQATYLAEESIRKVEYPTPADAVE